MPKERPIKSSRVDGERPFKAYNPGMPLPSQLNHSRTSSCMPTITSLLLQQQRQSLYMKSQQELQQDRHMISSQLSQTVQQFYQHYHPANLAKLHASVPSTSSSSQANLATSVISTSSSSHANLLKSILKTNSSNEANLPTSILKTNSSNEASLHNPVHNSEASSNSSEPIERSSTVTSSDSFIQQRERDQNLDIPRFSGASTSIPAPIFNINTLRSMTDAALLKQDSISQLGDSPTTQFSGFKSRQPMASSTVAQFPPAVLRFDQGSPFLRYTSAAASDGGQNLLGMDLTSNRRGGQYPVKLEAVDNFTFDMQKAKAMMLQHSQELNMALMNSLASISAKSASSVFLGNSSVKSTRSVRPENSSIDKATYSVTQGNSSMDNATCSVRPGNSSIDKATYSVTQGNSSMDKATYSVPLGNSSMDNATCSVRPGNSSMDNAICSVRPGNSSMDNAICSVRPGNSSMSMDNVPLRYSSVDTPTFSVPSGNSLMDKATCSVRPGNSSMDKATCSVRPGSSSMDKATCSVRPGNSSMDKATYSAGEESMSDEERNMDDDCRDPSYLEKRRKNNESAKRSRKARRTKETCLTLKVLNLEGVNMRLRVEIALLDKELDELRMRLCQSK